MAGIVVNCPHNPTGYCMDKAKQSRLVELARQYDVFIFSDEVYRYLSHPQPCTPRHQTARYWSCSPQD